MTLHAVELEKVTKRFGDHTAVDNIDLSVPKGAIYGFIGPNGSGKTTTLRMILRILLPEQGEVRVLGKKHDRAADDRVGYLPEERGLYRKMKVGETIRFHAALKGVRLDRRQTGEWLERFSLSKWGHKPVEALSKGMAQKVQFLTAIAHRPKLVVLDEPVSGLDPVSAEFISEQILSLRSEGATVILSTHDMNAAERLCDTIFMIHKGKKVLDGTLESIQDTYAAEAVRVKTTLDDVELKSLDGVRAVEQLGRIRELHLEPDFDAQGLLKNMVERGRVDHFEIARPSLRDIFVRIAKPVDAQR